MTALAESLAALGTAGALLLGLVILFRGHRNAERSQIDRAGACAEPTYERGSAVVGWAAAIPRAKWRFDVDRSGSG